MTSSAPKNLSEDLRLSSEAKTRIDAMWDRHMDRIERAVHEAPTPSRFAAISAFSNGFFFALALMAIERRIIEREASNAR